jgi:hypothetical protein
MDLSPSGRKAALERLGPSSPGERLADRHDERHLSAAERAARAEAEAEVLRWNPLPHIQNLDLSCYDREYAPEPQRRRAREAHLAQWPPAIDASVESLQAVPAPGGRAAGFPYAIVWTMIVGARAAFSYGATHSFSAQLAQWCATHQVTGAAITDGLSFMAITMVLIRTAGLAARATRLPRTPAGQVGNCVTATA